MPLSARLHGTPDRLPFVGHFRVDGYAGSVAFSVAGAVSSRCDLEVAFDSARCVERALRPIKPVDGDDKVSLLNRIWAAIVSIDGCDLGPNRGEDIVALIAVMDGDGVGIAGTGLGGVWAQHNKGLDPLVAGDHPLLGSPGRPERLPGVLTLDEPRQIVIAVPHDHPVPTLQFAGLERRCGVNP